MTIIQFDWMVNGLPVHAQYDQNDIETIWKPWIQSLESRSGKTIVFLAAPPGAGKSTLMFLFEHLSSHIQGLGMDGFHYPNHYLETHTTKRNGKSLLLRSIKGGPETFDVDALFEKIKQMKTQDVLWPIYDRQVHDVINDQIHVTKDIIIIEGNYLLLDQKPWNKLYSLCDTSMLLQEDANILKQRLIQRKIQGGLGKAEAIKFYEKSDKYNIEVVSHHSFRADMNLYIENGRFYRMG
ncbi:MAG: nucleoside/nucleotide kinase family protein [Absicoccus sp.]|uniref:nucleoside/nucleotide kinase family protein n=1 Tax=Absicoccus sp. TaxID=2718527 RepID=UPI002A753830|nr:nucleoside/nucleotide kinase family protein [Absicoccus sp.]MDY3035931.1 nucleoside/nucleotide kinase family protein [Absicoccus sp.]